MDVYGYGFGKEAKVPRVWVTCCYRLLTWHNIVTVIWGMFLLKEGCFYE